MLVGGWSRVLVLGGIRSGKSAFAESLVTDAPAVRYVATAADDLADPFWTARIAAHQSRRPGTWTTEEVGDDPSRLAALLTEAKPDEVLLVDDLGGWVAAHLDQDGDPIENLAEAVRISPARLVIVSPEVGLSVVPDTEVGRVFADQVGAANQAIAAACDTVVLVVAGQPTILKTSGGTQPAAPPAFVAPRDLPPVVTLTVPVLPTAPVVPTPPEVFPASVEGEPGDRDALREDTLTLPTISTGMVIQPGMDLPLPDETAAADARDRLRDLDVPGRGLGALTEAVAFAAGTQGRPVPVPWQTVRVLLMHGDQDGGASAGDSAAESARRARQALDGEGALAMLAAEAGAGLQLVEAPAARPFETEDTLTALEVDEALAYGRRLAEDAADSGVDVIVIGSCGSGSEAASAAVTAALTGAEAVALLGRVFVPGGRFDDNAWMTRCGAVRDALYRTRARPRSSHDLLAALAGGEIAVATGVLLGAATRRTPVLLDGPVGVAAALVSRDFGGQARHWCLLPDDGRHPMMRYAADVLGLIPMLDLNLGLGEGATALATLPLLRAVQTLSATLPAHPTRASLPEINDPAPRPSTSDDAESDPPTSA